MSQLDALISRGVSAEALPLVETAARVSRDLGDSEGLATTLAVKATLLERVGRLPEAARVAEEAASLLEELGLGDVARQLDYLLSSRPAPADRQFEPVEERPLHIPTPDPRADPRRAAQLSTQYNEDLARWNALPWWKRRTVKKPVRPTGI